MKSHITGILFAFITSGILFSCKKKEEAVSAPEPRLIFKFNFDSTQARLDAFGNPSTVASGNSAQCPRFNKMSSHYIEMTEDDFTALGAGEVLYRAKENTLGGSLAIDFDASKKVGDGETFFSIPLKDVTPGNYKWLRVSLAYQNYDITYKYEYMGTDYYATGTLASFIGFNTYIRDHKIKTLSETVNDDKPQGYWAFESLGIVVNGQAGTTTVPNPLSATSPIPANSCVVTGQFLSQPLEITGNETKDIVVIVSLSTNNSFEWSDNNGDGFYEPGDGDVVVDMGIRGMVPYLAD